MDSVAIASFIAETAFYFAYQIAGAVIAFTIFVYFLVLFRDKIINLERFYNVESP